MPVLVNGRWLGVQTNGVFSSANTDPIPGGRLWPEAALTWNALVEDAIKDGIPAWATRPTGPNSSARTITAQNFFWTHQPPPAARPGTSNHGWAIAVDTPDARFQAWLLIHGHKYGWSHDEGARVGEPWHFRYVGGVNLDQFRRQDPLRFMHPDELKTIKRYDKLNKKGLLTKEEGARKRALREKLTQMRKQLWVRGHATRDGWDHFHRKERYHQLRIRTT